MDIRIAVVTILVLLNGATAGAIPKWKRPKPSPSPTATPMPSPSVAPSPSIAPSPSPSVAPSPSGSVLPAPTGFSWATLCSTESWVRFQYNASLYSVQQFEFYRSDFGQAPVRVGTTVPNTQATSGSCYYNEFKFSGLSDYGTYAFYVVAVDAQGNRSAPASLTITTSGMFCSYYDRPSWVRFEYLGVTASSIPVRWQAPTGDPTVSSYRVYVSSSETAAPALVSASVQSYPDGTFGYTLNDLRQWTRYCVSVSSVSASGVESPKVMKCVATAGTPPPL